MVIYIIVLRPIFQKHDNALGITEDGKHREIDLVADALNVV